MNKKIHLSLKFNAKEFTIFQHGANIKLTPNEALAVYCELHKFLFKSNENTTNRS